MSDDFGTVSVRRGDRSREIEILRQHYRTHRDTLGHLAGEAPTEHLAAEYQRLIADIDSSLRKLDELEGRSAAAAPAPPVTAPPPPPTDTQRMRASPGQRPLVMTPAPSPGEPAPAAGRYDVPSSPAPSSWRALLIILAGLVVLGAIGWLIWRASSQRRPPSRPVVEQTSPTPAQSTAPADTGTVTPAVTPAPAAAPAALKITPALQDYGIIGRGTRAVRQFEAINSGSTPLTIDVARSNCRCLYYDYNKKVPAKGHETITVTVDAARAKSANIEEQIAVTVKEDPNAAATIGVRAAIK